MKKIIIIIILLNFLLNNSLVYAVSDKFYAPEKYAGQWPIGVVSENQSRGNPNNTRDTMGMKGNFSNEIGVKTKIFTSSQSPSFYRGGEDINGDGKDDLIYGYGGKLYLGDVSSGINIWETKVLDIKELLGVENVLGNGVKSIIVLLGEDRYLGIIDGQTGVLTWTSNSASGPVKYTKSSWPALDWKTFDINNDGIKEYHFKQRYNKYHSYRIFASGSTVIGDTLWSSQGYGDYNEGSDGYQVTNWAMGNINNKLVIGTKGSNTFSFYSNDINSTLSGSDKFKMPGFGKINVGGNTGNGWSNSYGYFYDLNGDGNDEYIGKIDAEVNNNKLSKVLVGGLNSLTGTMVGYTSISYPATYDASGSLINNGNYTVPIPLKNNSDSSESYVLTNGLDPVDKTQKRLMLKYNGLTSSGRLKTSSENSSFNYDIVYNAFDSSYTPSGIFNNGQKDYVVLRKGSDYYFYNFNGTGTFLTGSTLKITGGFYNIYDFLDKKREMNRNSGIFYSGYDGDGNGSNEFVVTDSNYFKFYEFNDYGVKLVKQLGPYNNVPGVIKRGLSSNKKDVYAITYNSTTNTINYYKSDVESNIYTFQKLTNDSFYSGGSVKKLSISKLGQGDNMYNRLMIEGVGMFDSRYATPAVSPTKLSNDYFAASYDVDNDGNNEVNIGNSAYTYNGSGSYTKKYQYFGRVGDINGDGVMDASYAYCGSTPVYDNNVFFRIVDGKTGGLIVPDIDWGNGNGYCQSDGFYSGVGFDANNDGVDEIAVGTAARGTRVMSYNSGSNSMTQGNIIGTNSTYNLQLYDVDNDGKKEILRGNDNSAIIKYSGTGGTTLSSTINVVPGVKSTWATYLGLPSIYKDGLTTYFAYMGADGEVSLMSLSGGVVTKNFTNYYVNGSVYNNFDSVLGSNFMPVVAADVFVGDFLGNNTTTVLVGGGDGGVYILGLDGSILKYFNIGSSIRRIIIGDVSNSGFLSVFVSAEDGYVYQLTNSNLAEPLWVKDGPNYGYDIESQTDNKKVNVNYASVSKATGYFVQLYNKTEKSIVFDWIDVGNKLKACIVSKDVTDANCISATKTFSLNGKSIYEWRVQAYNSNVTSTTISSNGFSVLNLAINKVVAKKEDLNFQDDITVSPNTIVTYKITVTNDSLNTVGGAGYMNYDMSPAQPVSSCSGISDCREKNLTISDYMPTSFTYMPNTTTWIIKKFNLDGSEHIISGGSQVSDSYFRNQSKTTLPTTQGATLIWQFPTNISVPPGAFLELQFDAIARIN